MTWCCQIHIQNGHQDAAEVEHVLEPVGGGRGSGDQAEEQAREQPGLVVRPQGQKALHEVLEVHHAR